MTIACHLSRLCGCLTTAGNWGRRKKIRWRNRVRKDDRLDPQFDAFHANHTHEAIRGQNDRLFAAGKPPGTLAANLSIAVGLDRGGHDRFLVNG
jgi:hypothetical protein